jgi:hypothetical protein
MARREFDWGSIAKNIVESEKKGFNKQDDSTLFVPKIKEDGTHNSIIRFLPPCVGESLPQVKLYTHGFSDKGWFINNCPTTIGGKCYVCEENGKLWDENPNLVRKRSRKLSIYSNILVVKDPQCPENEGKVFKYRYGVKIHEKILEKIAPKDTDIDVMVPVFSYESGANFKLKIKTITTKEYGKEKKQPNYDASAFAEPTPIGLDKPFTDKQIDELETKLYSLNSIVDPSVFKSYDQLRQEFLVKTGGDASESQGAPKQSYSKSYTKVSVPSTESSDDVATGSNDFYDMLNNEN